MTLINYKLINIDPIFHHRNKKFPLTSEKNRERRTTIIEAKGFLQFGNDHRLLGLWKKYSFEFVDKCKLLFKPFKRPSETNLDKMKQTGKLHSRSVLQNNNATHHTSKITKKSMENLQRWIPPLPPYCLDLVTSDPFVFLKKKKKWVLKKNTFWVPERSKAISKWIKI